MNVSPYDNGNDFEDIGFDVDNINFKKPLLFGFFSHQYQAAPKTVSNNMRSFEDTRYLGNLSSSYALVMV